MQQCTWVFLGTAAYASLDQHRPFTTFGQDSARKIIHQVLQILVMLVQSKSDPHLHNDEPASLHNDDSLGLTQCKVASDDPH